MGYFSDQSIVEAAPAPKMRFARSPAYPGYKRNRGKSPVNAYLTGTEVLERLKIDPTETSQFVETQAGKLVAILHSTAPLGKTDNLRAGIVASPWEERTAVPGKVVREVYFDHKMNNVFVKYSLNGTRYYYPASQEYGFMTSNRTGGNKHIPGKYFMRDSAIEFAPAYEAAAARFISGVANGD